MKKVLKYLGLGLLLLIVGLVVAGFIASEPLPEQRQAGPKADALARKMEAAVNKAAWDSTRFVSWAFRTGTCYMWDKDMGAVEVKWGDHRVLLNTANQSGKVYTNGALVTNPEQARDLLDKAWSQFANDSFWLCAHMKAFDPGTTREIVTTDDGRTGLLVNYSSGGVTPGDKYLWFLDDAGLPVSYKMWVNIIPIGGLEFTWEDWTTGPGQPKIARQHDGAILDVPIDDLTFPKLSPEENPLREIY